MCPKHDLVQERACCVTRSDGKYRRLRGLCSVIAATELCLPKAKAAHTLLCAGVAAFQ